MREKQADVPHRKQMVRPQQNPEEMKEGAGSRSEPEDRLLLVQIILCVVVVLAVLAVQLSEAPFLDTLRGQYSRMINEGMQFGTGSPIVRFGSQTVEVLRGGLQAVLATLDSDGQQQNDEPVLEPWADDGHSEETAAFAKGAGGYWPSETQNADSQMVTEPDSIQLQSGANAQRQPPEGASFAAYTLEHPLALPVQGALTSGYGYRENPVNGEEDFHAGLDIACEMGDPVGACLPGQVAFTGSNAIRGNYMILRHGNGVQTLYQHLSCVVVRPGQVIKQGQTIGMAGSTGLSTGPHVHLELILNGIRVNPLPGMPELDPQQTASFTCP